MAYILNIETSTKNCSVALAKDGEMIVCREIAEMGYSHAEKLHVFIEEILSEANLKFSDLNAVAVSQGPGSYTGLRIGVSAAKGLCYALDIPLIAVDTLEVLASQIAIEEGVIVPMIDARRMEVYSAIFDKNHQKIRETKAEILTEDSFSDINQTIYFIGDSSQKAKTLLQKDNFVFVDDVIYPSAKQMTKKSYTLFTNNRFEDVAYFEPLYLKDFMIS
ncbi:MAG TPA: tRNA (adenosine(37)-N6)-threonylcarbamoyltransferase complex dimerization subunit type 1 TsaB [Flavobacterium sp.]|uniref:tRNA (adenosine(37)-N6)-threonylcarbamoyltransferase complex dimerization subunit type 1 TsaB n=1 Tax=unclassified Flavobacterium TaxID=196869 RepID=UPI000E856B48|nr:MULTISPECIES: tRNA (adenosine(37)-N6)-threonylcarbamoyltransferase complex dimerization subunit type 1 TsaB [unclassified Flavobacterium]HBI01364.1 tRNA (adenosine(37)-N6)-threonylcarbamoyltransferase complex dimerization subunit type 1 TsaB [Flavobacterium sp.]HRE76188.1 tRNA (adenosine(37)-N6)-threonylcarbamoyltransferase complex dimerization subunit type 1 TsaB [Flavobacterium sp.]